ncbi:MAG: peptidylprolyl isomerase [Kiritimatiellales bacterium]
MIMIEDGKKVRIHYTGTLNDGSQFDSSAGRDPLEFETGAGMVIPGFDSAVRDMEIGGKKTVTIPAKEAYGEARDEMIGDIPKDRFPAEMALSVGMPLQMQGPQGPLPVVVKEIKEDAVTIDANHPLAGKDLTFELELVEVI